MDFVKVFFKDFVLILSEMAPFLLLGFFFAGILHAFIPRRRVEKYFNGSPLRSSILASLFGVPLPLCSCGVIPTGIAFYKNGASKGGTISFLISTPQTGVDSILATFSLLGLPFAVIRPIAALITGVTGGLITSRITRNENNEDIPPSVEVTSETLVRKAFKALHYGFVLFVQDISKWLVIGLVLAAFISALIPENFFSLLNLPPIFQMLLILVISIPLYICATGSIPLAAVLMLKGISPGAAFVLLMAGPATNAATITMIAKVLGRRSLWAYLATIVVGALSFGLFIDYVFPQDWFSGFSASHSGHAHGNHLMWWQISSAIVLSLLIIFGRIRKYLRIKSKNSEKITQHNMEKKVIQVEGMMCNHCKANVEKTINALPFVKSATVNLENKTVMVEGSNIEIQKVKEEITSLGYNC